MMRMRTATVAVFAALGVFAPGALTPSLASAQIRASEAATISQTIDGATFTVEYSRPRVRGRKDIFGKQVTWDEVWTPGANRATTLRATRDFFINGHAVPKGKYSLWIQVKEKGEWLFLLHPDTMRQHFMHPRVESAKLSFGVTPQHVPSTEVLTWSFPSVTGTGATLELDWADVRIPLDLRVVPSVAQNIDAAEAAPYIGEYEIEWLWGSTPVKDRVVVRYDAKDGSLHADTRMNGEPSNMILARISPNVFSPIFMMEGEAAEAAETMLIEFTPSASGKSDSFQIRDKNTDQLQARAKRIGSS